MRQSYWEKAKEGLCFQQKIRVCNNRAKTACFLTIGRDGRRNAEERSLQQIPLSKSGTLTKLQHIFHFKCVFRHKEGLMPTLLEKRVLKFPLSENPTRSPISFIGVLGSDSRRRCASAIRKSLIHSLKFLFLQVLM